MDERTFVEMTENMRHTNRRFVEIVLDGSACVAYLTYFARMDFYSLHLYVKDGRETHMVMCIDFVRAEPAGSYSVCLIPRRGSVSNAPVLNTECFRLKVWKPYGCTLVECSTIVEQGEVAAHG